MTTKAVLIAGTRTGGTYLGCALSNHPQIFCIREEIFHRDSTWKAIKRDQRLAIIYNQQFYDVGMFKVTLAQVVRTKLADCIASLKPKIIYLKREKIVEQAASLLINNLTRARQLKGHPTHTFRSVKPPKVTLNPREYVQRYNEILGRRKAAEVFFRKAKKVSGYSVHRVTYEKMIAQPNLTMEGICNFLGVKPYPFVSWMKKVHTVPYPEFVTNWDELVRSVR